MTPARVVVAVFAAGLVACGRSEPAPDPLKAQRSAIQKAKGVEATVDNAAAERRNRVDDAETK